MEYGCLITIMLFWGLRNIENGIYRRDARNWTVWIAASPVLMVSARRESSYLLEDTYCTVCTVCMVGGVKVPIFPRQFPLVEPARCPICCSVYVGSQSKGTTRKNEIRMHSFTVSRGVLRRRPLFLAWLLLFRIWI